MGVFIYFYKLKLEISENMELSEKNKKKAETPSLEQSLDKRDEPVKVQIVCPTMDKKSLSKIYIISWRIFQNLTGPLKALWLGLQVLETLEIYSIFKNFLALKIGRELIHDQCH